MFAAPMPEIATQKGAHDGVGAHISVTILRIHEAARSKRFLLAEDVPVRLEGRTIQVPCPHMDAVRSKRWSGFGVGPGKDLCTHIKLQVSERTPIPIGSKR